MKKSRNTSLLVLHRVKKRDQKFYPTKVGVLVRLICYELSVDYQHLDFRGGEGRSPDVETFAVHKI